MDNQVAVEENKNKIDALLVLRSFACMMVVMCHVIGPFSPDVNIISAFGHNITWLIRTTGAIGVWTFFILLMGKGFYLERYTPTLKSSLNFYFNRFLRIYPLYIFSILIVLIFNFKSFSIFNPTGLKTMIQLLTLTYSGGMAFPNALLWTISTEFQFYLLVPFVFILAKAIIKNTKWFLISMTIILLIWLAYRYNIYLRYFGSAEFYGKWIHKSYIPLKANLDLFLSGFLLNFLVQSRKLKANASLFMCRLKKNIALLSFAAMYVFYNYVSYKAQLFMAPIYSPIFYIGMQTVVIFAVCFLIYQFETKNNYKIPPVQWSYIKQNPLRVFEVFGILTYGIYIWHTPIILSMGHIGYGIKSVKILFWIKFLYTFLLSTLVSICTYLLIEKRFEKMKKFTLKKKDG